jgi:hypothetical protein
MTDRPSWWAYPERCYHGHEWGPGQVTVGWLPCECPEAQAENLGHLWVGCQAEPGCTSIWYRPAHSPSPDGKLTRQETGPQRSTTTEYPGLLTDATVARPLAAVQRRPGAHSER